MTKVSDYIDKPIVIHIGAEMGAGKSTFIELLLQYEKWLQENEGLDGRLIYPFIEDTPHGKVWEDYQTAIEEDKPNDLFFKVQSWFMKQKLGLLHQAAGLEYLGTPGFFEANGNSLSDKLDSKSDFFNYDYDPTTPRAPGLYIVERLPIADMKVFAARYADKFLPGNSTVPGSFENYEAIFGEHIDESPLPDLFVRLKSTPELSMQRVIERGTGEKLVLKDYKQMEAAYTLFVDPWIEETKVPCVEMNMSLPEFDYNTPQGQQYLLGEFIRKIHEIGVWKPSKYVVPIKPLLELENGN